MIIISMSHSWISYTLGITGILEEGDIITNKKKISNPIPVLKRYAAIMYGIFCLTIFSSVHGSRFYV